MKTCPAVCSNRTGAIQCTLSCGVKWSSSLWDVNCLRERGSDSDMSARRWCEPRLWGVGPRDRRLAGDLPGELVEEPLPIRDEVGRRRECQKVLPLPAQLVDLVEDRAERRNAFVDGSGQCVGQVDALVT